MSPFVANTNLHFQETTNEDGLRSQWVTLCNKLSLPL